MLCMMGPCYEKLYVLMTTDCMFAAAQVSDFPSFQLRESLAGHMERVVTTKFDPSGRQALHTCCPEMHAALKGMLS